METAPAIDIEERPSKAASALMGAAAGAAGVWALDRLDWAMWDSEPDDARRQTVSVRPDGEPPAQALVTGLEELTGATLSPDAHELAAQVVHYSIGIAPAVLYAMFRDRLPGNGVARGAMYGAGLFLAQDEVMNSVTGLGGRPDRYPWQDHARGLVAHMLYGVVTELALSLLDRSRRRALAA